MSKPLEPTGEPGEESARGHAYPVTLVDDLRNGERDAFVRFYELSRLAVYRFVLRLLRDPDAAQVATREVFVRAYRQILLHAGAADLTSLVYKTAVDTCGERAGLRTSPGALPGAGGSVAGRHGVGERDDLAGRFEEALRSLDDRQHAALLLHDVHGLRRDEIGAVLGLSSDAAAALLFRASEAFRWAFSGISVATADGACRLAEAAAASAVGRRTLPDDEARRLRDHAAYCRDCRDTMAAWGSGAVGLALLLDEAPLPDALRAAPVFGAISPVASPRSAERGEDDVGAAAVSGSAAVVAILATIGRALTSKAAAYAVAAVCFAGFLGLAVYVSQHEWQLRRPFLPSGHPVAGAPRLLGRSVGEDGIGGRAGNVARRANGQSGDGVAGPGSDAAAVPYERGADGLVLARLGMPVLSQAGHLAWPVAPAAGGAGGAGPAGSPQGATRPRGRGVGGGPDGGAVAGKSSLGGPGAGKHAGKHAGKATGRGNAKSSGRGQGDGRRRGGAAAPHAAASTSAGKTAK